MGGQVEEIVKQAQAVVAEHKNAAITVNRLKQLETKAKRLRDELDTIHWQWEDTKKALAVRGIANIQYDWGDVLA
jgi:hypothetical protein